ncbi:hypothetical protein [Streptomyces sp. NBC_00207]|uniref:hypothetical protein n=1 Tax=unclassified Streptomyces TaxID=2593676 RepID=UPI003250C8E6
MSGPSDRPARPWSAVHDNGRIPVGFRLHLTATPRILAAAWPQKCKDGRELEIASMPSDPACPPCEWIYHLEPQPKPWVVSAVFRNDSGTWHEILHRTTSTRSRRTGTPDRPPPYRAGRCNAGRSRQRQAQAS